MGNTYSNHTINKDCLICWEQVENIDCVYCIQCNISTNIVAYNMYKNVMRTLLLVRRNTLIIYVRVCPISKDRSKSSSPY